MPLTCTPQWLAPCLAHAIPVAALAGRWGRLEPGCGAVASINVAAVVGEAGGRGAGAEADAGHRQVLEPEDRAQGAH